MQTWASRLPVTSGRLSAEARARGRSPSASGAHPAAACRLKDDTVWISHPRVFEPYVNLLRQRNASAPALSSSELLAAIETLTLPMMEDAESQLPPETVRPVLAADLLAAFAQLYNATNLARPQLWTLAPPRLLLEPKGRMFEVAALQSFWALAGKHRVRDRIALYAVDRAHHDIVMEATQSKVRIIWGYMDQDFADHISSVPFPAPVPPDAPVRPRASRQVYGDSGRCVRSRRYGGPLRLKTLCCGDSGETRHAVQVGAC